MDLGKKLLQALGWILIVSVGLAWPGWYWFGAAGMQAIGWAALVCLMGSLASLIPVVLTAQRRRQWLVQACLAAAGIRKVGIAGIVFLVYLAVLEARHRLIYALSILVFYLTLLIWETWVVVKYARLLCPGDGKEGLK